MPTTITNNDAESVIAIWTAATMYVSLHTADPGKTGANELTSFGREEITSANWAAFADDATTTGRKKDSDTELNYGNAPSTETVTHFGFWDASTNGTFRGAAELTTPQEVTSGNEVRFQTGDLTIVAAGQDQTDSEES